LFHFSEDLFQAHDGAGFHVAALAERRAQWRMGQVPLG
jgi:hypothetical protein